MSKPRRASKHAKDDGSRPSMFFIIALVVGFAILVWWFIHFLPERTTGTEPEKQGVIVVDPGVASSRHVVTEAPPTPPGRAT